MKLQIHYRITGLGWAECAIEDEVAACTITASYLDDALGNLVLGACAALRYFDRIGFQFEEEPGEYRWVLTSPRLNEVDLRIYEFAESRSNKPDDGGKLLFSTTCLPLVFAQAVHAAATNLVNEVGEEGYKEQWSEHPFPSPLLQELSRLIELHQ